MLIAAYFKFAQDQLYLSLFYFCYIFLQYIIIIELTQIGASARKRQTKIFVNGRICIP